MEIQMYSNLKETRKLKVNASLDAPLDKLTGTLVGHLQCCHASAERHPSPSHHGRYQRVRW